MGFDNDCILNIQSLAGEYFCPVCRLLVYPTEALQSQCTHLYCKPCLAYVVSTTNVCPYDGYVVTEADSKPLIEVNKSLAETIGKIAVHCLFHRSGCTWKGSLSECPSHCTGCAFGNSAVVCNRCGTQIMHRQVHEHALTCPGAAASATGTATAADQTQATAATSQAQPLQTAVTAPGKDLSQQSISSSPAVQATVLTPEQWYQQQHQLYYQQYPGYDPSQQQYQHYYPYQQAAVPQYQQHAHASNATGQLQLQPQTQPQPPASNIQAALATQPQNQTQGNPQQQAPSVVPPHSQIQSQTYPPTPGQPYPQPQIQQQIQLPTQPHNPLSQPYPLSQAHPLGQLQPNHQLNQPPNANFWSQTQHPSAHVVTPMQVGGLQQHPVHAQPQVVFTQSQNPVQMQSQLPKQAPMVRPPHSRTITPSQPQPALMPSPGQVQNTSPAQQQSVQQPYFQHPGQPVHQRPIMQPVQQTFLQQLPMPSQLRPTGQSHLFPPQAHAYPRPTMQQATTPNLVGGPTIPNQGVQAQPYSQYAGGVIRPAYPGSNQQASNQDNMLKTNDQMQFPSKQRTRVNSIAAMSEGQGNPVFEKAAAQQEVETFCHKTVKDGVNNWDSVPDIPANAREVKIEKSETDVKFTELEHKSTEDKADQTNETYLSKNGDSSLQKKSPLKSVERHESQGGNLVMEALSSSDGGSKGVPVASAQILGNPVPGSEVKSSYPHGVQDKSRPQVSLVEFQGFPHPNQVQTHQLPGPPLLLQVPPPGPPHQTHGLGAQQTHFRPQLLSQSDLGQQSSELRSIAPQGPYNPGPSGSSRLSQGEPIGAQASAVLPPHAFDSHGGMMARATPYGPDMFPNQRPNFMDSWGFDPHGPVGPRDERFNPFPTGSNHRPEFEHDLKQFPRPFDRGPHGLKYDTGLKMDSGVGSVSSRFLSPYNGGGANEVGDLLGGRHEDTFQRMDPTRGHLDFFGPGPGYGRRHMDSWASRSPGRELPGISSRGFGGPGPDDIHGRELGRFGEPYGGSFHESRFSMFTSHRHWVEFEGPHNMGMGDHLRNDLIGQDGFSGPLRWGEHMGGPHGRSHLGEPIGFGPHPRHSRMREMGGPGSFDSFGRGDGPSFPRLGEPGFRSRFSPHGFPTDDGIFTGDLAFDKSRKRKPPAMGWCRICKVDCKTVEGLDLHSQTREHQKMAMDMVVTIKQNAKKKKLTFGDQSSLGDASQPRSVGSEAMGKTTN